MVSSQSEMDRNQLVTLTDTEFSRPPIWLPDGLLLYMQLKGLYTLMICVGLQPANQIHEPSSTAAACPHLPADLDVQRFDQAGRHSVRHWESNLRLRDTELLFSLMVRVKIFSYPKNADPFCSATVHLPLWDTHTHTDDSLFDYVCVLICMCIILAAATLHIKAKGL